ncbi:MAG: hypothetical protein DRO88_01900, partial [Promethearchaeia archaeon]
TYKVGKRYQQKKNEVIRNIFLFTAFMALANLSAAVSRIIRILTWEPDGPQNLEGLVFAVIFIAISNNFLLQFGLAIFHPDLEKQKKVGVISIYGILTLVFIIFALITGMYTEDLTTNIWSFLVILALIVDVYIFIGSFRMIRKLSNRVDKIFVLFILFTPISLVFVYIFFFIDILLGGKFTIFYYFGWLTGVIAAILLYFGVFRPKFLEERLKK